MKVVLMAIVLFGALALHMPKQPETFNSVEGAIGGIYGQPGLGFGGPPLGFGVPWLRLQSGGYGIGFAPSNYGFVPRHGSRPGGGHPR
ncbi:hypothetical protein AMTRI_Chr02g220240 [Amborella trichopoda]